MTADEDGVKESSETESAGRSAATSDPPPPHHPAPVPGLNPPPCFPPPGSKEEETQKGEEEEEQTKKVFLVIFKLIRGGRPPVKLLEHFRPITQAPQVEGEEPEADQSQSEPGKAKISYAQLVREGRRFNIDMVSKVTRSSSRRVVTTGDDVIKPRPLSPSSS